MTPRTAVGPFSDESVTIEGEVAPSTSLRLRIATAQDRDQVVRLIEAVAQERKYLRTDRYSPTPQWERLLKEGMALEEGLLLLVAAAVDGLAGFGRLLPDSAHPLGRAAGNIGLALSPQYRGRGLGAIILRKLLACSEPLGYELVTADILEGNSRSLALFMKCGFSQAGLHREYVPSLGAVASEVRVQRPISRREDQSR